MKRHVIINNKANIIDFESASTKRRTSNVTSVCQYLFVGNKNSSIIRKILKIKSKNGIIKILKKYKNDKNRLNSTDINCFNTSSLFKCCNFSSIVGKNFSICSFTLVLTTLSIRANNCCSQISFPEGTFCRMSSFLLL